ncbi:unnamed protein product [Clavelina lepadiformis]|uniref:TELO2-interacting protein 1 n=1 Tax=Clavelina lepadiformis TaxID=159417 RepID=A0ABP0FI90_CLALP
MSGEAEVKKAFNDLRPLCVGLTKNADKASILSLHSQLKSTPCMVIQALHEYFLFPLRIVLLKHKETKEDVIIAAINCMTYIFENIKLTEFKVFYDTLKLLIVCITSASNDLLEASGSEDLKLNVICALSKLINTSSSPFWKTFYNPEYVPIMGHLITICLSVISKDENKKLRTDAILLIGSLCMPAYSDSLKDNDRDSLTLFCGDCMVSLMPGILSCLAKVVSGDAKQGQAVKCRSLETISKLLRTTVGDTELKFIEKESLKQDTESTSNTGSGRKLYKFQTKRTEKWLMDVSPKINAVLLHMSVATNSSSVTVRLAFASFASEILNSCQHSLKDCVQTLMAIPIKLLHDEHDNVSTRCRDIVEQLSNMSHESTNLTHSIYDLLFDICTNLPQNLRKSSDEQKLASLQLLLGYLDVCKQDLQGLMNSSVHLTKLMKALLFCFEMDFSDLHKISEIVMVSSNYAAGNPLLFKGKMSNWIFNKSFTNFNNDLICKTLLKVCRLLGQYGDIEVFVDTLLDWYENESLCHQCVVILNEILLGIEKDTHVVEGAAVHIDTLIDVYTSPENWYLATSHQSAYLKTHHATRLMKERSHFLQLTSDKKEINLRCINSNVSLACLHLESISTFALICGTKFRDNLQKVLYSVLEKVNDTNHLISSCALETLKIVSSSCNYKNVSDLICDNADYLVSTISVHLRHLSLFPRSPAVLQAMLTHSDISVFPLVRDTIDEVLTVLDVQRFESERLLAILPVLLATVTSINRWFLAGVTYNNDPHNNIQRDKEDDKEENNRIEGKDRIVAEIKRCIVDFQQNLSTSIDFESGPSSGIDVSNNPNDEDSRYDNLTSMSAKDEKPPNEVIVVDEVVSRCGNLLSSRSVKIRIVTMEIIYEGLQMLSKHENTLLPRVHGIWGTLIARCRDKELQIVARAFDIICLIASYSGDFIRRRLTKDVLPKLLDFLKNHSKSVKLIGRDAQIAFKHSTVFKLQRDILNKLGPLLVAATVSFDDIHETFSVCYVFLNAKQPQELQDAAVNLFRNLIRIDPDSMWLSLSNIYSPTSTFEHLNFTSGLQTIQISESTNVNSEFAKNIGSLLKLC